jgi:hypothetical protein
MTLQDIALHLKEHQDITVTPMTISNDVSAVMDQVQDETRKLATHHRTIMLERIEHAIKAIFGEVIKGDVPAIHALVRLMEREAKLSGADAPAKIDIEWRIRMMAREQGFDEDEAVRTAETTYQEQRKLLTAG